MILLIQSLTKMLFLEPFVLLLSTISMLFLRSYCFSSSSIGYDSININNYTSYTNYSNNNSDYNNIINNNNNNNESAIKNYTEDDAILASSSSTAVMTPDVKGGGGGGGGEKEEGEELRKNLVGFILGDPCVEHCSDNLSHAFCNFTSKLCECEQTHPIELNSFACIAPLHLGEICNYEESCIFYDANSFCEDESLYYSICACKDQYLPVERGDGTRKCELDPSAVVATDVPTFFGVGIGLTLFSGMTCLVLKLFSKARFGQPRGHYANANIAPPMMMTGMTTPVSAAPSRRSSGRSTPGSRRPSYSMLAPPSRTGSRRPSVASIRSQASIRSYRYDRGHHHHESLRATVSAPITDLSSPTQPISNVRMLEQKFAHYSGYSRNQERGERDFSRHSSQEIITEVIAETPEKT